MCRNLTQGGLYQSRDSGRNVIDRAGFLHYNPCIVLAYGPPKTLYNRWKRWSDNGVFENILTALAAAADAEGLMIDATHLTVHRTAASLGSNKGGVKSAGRVAG